MPYFPPNTDSTKLPLAGGTMTGQITSTLGTITTDIRPFSSTVTWNNAAVTFRGLFLNVTQTAFSSASVLLQIQANATNMFHVDAIGKCFAYDRFQAPNFYDSASKVGLKAVGIELGSARYVAWDSTDVAYGTIDTGLYRNAARVVEVNNGTAGTFGDILVRSAIIDGAPSTAGAGQIAIGADTRTTIGANGAATALTALPVGYIDINVAGIAYQIPYFSRGA